MPICFSIAPRTWGSLLSTPLYPLYITGEVQIPYLAKRALEDIVGYVLSFVMAQWSTPRNQHACASNLGFNTPGLRSKHCTSRPNASLAPPDKNSNHETRWKIILVTTIIISKSIFISLSAIHPLSIV